MKNNDSNGNTQVLLSREQYKPAKDHPWRKIMISVPKREED